MPSVAYSLDAAQAPIFRPPGIPDCYWISLCYIRSKCQGDAVPLSAWDIGNHYANKTGKPIRYKRLLGERHKKWLRDHGHLESIQAFFNRIRVLFTPAPKKPPAQAQSNDTGHDTGQAKPFKFSSFSDSDIFNIENTERLRVVDRPSTNQTKTDLWAEFNEWTLTVCGQICNRIQLGVLTREAKRRGMTFWQFWQRLKASGHHLSRAKNLGKLLWSILINNFGWPSASKDSSKPSIHKPKRSQEELDAETWAYLERVNGRTPC